MEVSKKLKLNAEGTLIIDDGSEALEDKQKEAEKLAKETQKELDKASDLIDDINNAKLFNLKMKDGAGKTFSIKKLKEQLTLSEDEDLDEAIPKDLVKAYKYSRYNIPRDVDLQNTEYQQVTSEEALKIAKNGGFGDLRLLLPGESELILLQNGRGSMTHRSKYVGYDLAYTKSTGTVVFDTAYMPTAHLLKIASKIYYVPQDKIAYKDPALVAKRKTNPESRNYIDRTRSRDGHAAVMPSRNGGSWSSRKSRINSIIRDEEALRALKKAFNDGAISQQEYDRDRQQYIRDMKYARQSLGDMRNSAARLRNLESEKSLQASIKRFDDLKDRVYDAQRRVNRAAKDLDDVKNQGSPEVKALKNDYRDCLERLKQLQRKIALYELKLEGADDDDIEAIKQAEAVLNARTDDYNNAMAELDRLLRRS